MPTVLEEGRNCWRISRASRLRILIDPASYFDVLARTFERAERSILIIGWDFNSRIRLRRGDEEPELATLLERCVRGREHLHVHVLNWDFAPIYAMERELFPSVRLGWFTHDRFHYALDGRHPVGASHHQKIVVVDDRVAFVGGIDLAACRWDTPEHLPDDPRRTAPWGESYDAFHDVQCMVEGEAARALGELGRERWRRALGEELPPSEETGDVWPEYVAADLADVDVGIARTEPACDGRSEIREVETLYADMLRSARESVYIENQYFTARVLREVLGEVLARSEGAEIIAVGPDRCAGWLEETTMGVLRARLLKRLAEHDRSGRFRYYCPYVPDLPRLSMHSKVTVVDDRILRIGSANLNNRSMGLDTECDLVIESDESRVQSAIAGVRNRLLAEHLGVPVEQVERRVAEKGSVIGAVESLRDEGRSLRPLEPDLPEWMDRLVPSSEYVDPEEPVDLSVPEPELLEEEESRSTLLRVGMLVAAALGFAAFWRWGPTAEWLDPHRLVDAAQAVREHSLAPLWMIGAFVVGGLVVFPVTILIIGTAMTFGATVGVLLSVVGTLASAVVVYAVGRVAGRRAVAHLLGDRMDRVRRMLDDHGIWMVAGVRIIPVAPYSIVNLVLGAFHVDLRTYVVGTTFAMLPGTIVLSIVGERMQSTVRQPTTTNVTVLIFAVALAAALPFLLRYLLRRLRHD